MMLDPDACYRAMSARDPRFDGRFFVGVSSTGVYCRPVCRARRPKPGNCSFFPSAAAAEAAGYRPCLLCRPELAPGNAGVDASGRLAQRAAGMIEDRISNGLDLDALAQGLAVTLRHLRRVFKAEFGVSPVVFAQTQRLLLAKRLLTDTHLSMAEVAFACGFGSIQRFNALFQERYRLSPTTLRKQRRGSSSLGAFRFELTYRPPLDWDALRSFLGRRAIGGVESVDGDTYYRTLRIEHHGEIHTGWISASPSQTKPALIMMVSASLSKVLPRVLSRAKQAFDLSSDPDAVAAGLGDLAARRPGLRLPGSWDGFELTARAILGQQVTVQAARTLATRLVRSFGEPLTSAPAGLSHLFPTAERLAETSPADIQVLGVVGTRARSIVGVAQAVASGELSIAPGGDPTLLDASLRRLQGVGDWTAEYVVMRGLTWPDSFPASDRGVLRAMQEDDPKRAQKRAEVWRPWRSYAVMHLWRMLEEQHIEDRRSTEDRRPTEES
ncbi:MAG: helix-turn-helix domain-containing protein [Actinobacteria bacterium]|jgi:AraC family transcriptional regulator of adaptative response / DNA-3-methyladenine glycosylase II|nr:helix-turn-helix domain-containing protein [Actinomycetota bacterium]